MPDLRGEIRARLAAARLEPTRDMEIVEEIAAHLDRHAELVADGATADEQEASRRLLQQRQPRCFQTLGIPLLLGRDFGAGDTPAATKVLIVNELLAKQLGGDETPLGRMLRVEAGSTYAEEVYRIVGVVKDSKYTRLRDDVGPIAYLPAAQVPGRTSPSGSSSPRRWTCPVRFAASWPRWPRRRSSPSGRCRR